MRQAGRGEVVVAVLGVALLALLWSPWYGTSGPGSPQTIDAWQAFSVTDVVIALFAAACVAQAVVLAGIRSPAIGLTWNVCVNWAAIVLIVWIVVELFNTPPGYDSVEPGAWASLAVAAMILLAGWLTLADERTEKAPDPDVPLRPLPPVGASGEGAPR